MEDKSLYTSYLFYGIIQYAHDAVQNTYKQVKALEREWHENIRNQNQNQDSSTDKLKELIGLLGSMEYKFSNIGHERRDEIFRYLCTASIYAKSILKSSSAEKSDSNNYDPEGKELTMHSVTLNELHENAEKVVEELKKITYTGNLQTANEADINNHFANISGRMTRFHKIGQTHTPCLIVRSDKESEVGLRKGFELRRKINNRSRTVDNINDSLKLYPVKVYADGEIQAIYRQDDNLGQILEKEEDRRKVLEFKHITWIHKEYSSSDRNFATYFIDFADENVERDQELDSDLSKELEGIAGETRKELKPCLCKNEDVLITYFADILFNIEDKDKNILQRLEKWSRLSILDYIENENSKMYIGFDFGTIQDAEYFNKAYVSGSTNLLLLALTRGMMELYESLNIKAINHEEQEVDNNGSGNSRIKEGSQQALAIKVNEIDSESGMEQAKRKKVESEEFDEKKYLFLGANSSGILVRVENYPNKLIRILTFSVVVWLLFGAMLIICERNLLNKEEANRLTKVFCFGKVIGALFELWSAFLAFFLVVMSYSFPTWEFRDILRKRRRVCSLTDLIDVLGGEKERAIRLCSKVKNPDTIFSHHDSCAFTERGEGEFEIDCKLTVRDLQGDERNEYSPNYKFGVNYYGEAVMADTDGHVRKLEYSCQGAEGTIHVKGYHGYGFRYIMELPTRGRAHVGSRTKQE